MKKLILLSILSCVCSGIVYAGPEPAKSVVAPVEEWYGDREFNVNLWGAYAFTGTEFAPNLDLIDLIVSTTEGETVLGTFDRYLGNDHAWGGGGDLKYFFSRYFGVGVQGFALSAKRTGFDIESRPLDDVFDAETTTDCRVVGGVLGTFTLRYPMPSSRFAPYAWAGVGAIFGGGESDKLITTEIEEPDLRPAGEGEGDGEIPFVDAQTIHHGSRTELMGQFGGGLEFRFTRHVGWTNDFSWNVINGAHNDFGMFRSGINFAF